MHGRTWVGEDLILEDLTGGAGEFPGPTRAAGGFLGPTSHRDSSTLSEFHPRASVVDAGIPAHQQCRC